MKLSKRWHMILTALVLALCLGACTKTMSYTFHVETGDKIKVAMDITDGYTFSQKEGTFTASMDGRDILTGIFLTGDMYDQYLEAIQGEEFEILKESQQNGCSYIQYRYEGDHIENNFVCWVTDSNTGLFLASLEDQQSAEDAFERLSFSKE